MCKNGYGLSNSIKKYRQIKSILMLRIIICFGVNNDAIDVKTDNALTVH